MADPNVQPTPAQKLQMAIAILAASLIQKEMWKGRPNPQDPQQRPKDMCTLYFNPEQQTGIEQYPTMSSLAKAIEDKGKELRISAEFDLMDGSEKIKANMISAKPNSIICVVRRFSSVGRVEAGLNNYGEATQNRVLQQVAGVTSTNQVNLAW